MAVTNTDEVVADDNKTVTEEDLRDLKYPKEDVETSEEADETTEGEEEAETTEEAGESEEQSEEQAEETEDKTEESEAFVKQFSNIKGDTPEEYAKNLETAYSNSFAELKRLRDAGKTNTESGGDENEEAEATDPISLYMKQKMDEEITEAYTEFSKHFPQVADPVEYDKFTSEVAILSRTIHGSQGRLASPKELYSKAAVILGWEAADKVSDKDRLGNALKDSAAVSKTSNASTKSKKPSKVSDAMIAANRRMYPNKTDAEIRAELEPYV